MNPFFQPFSRLNASVRFTVALTMGIYVRLNAIILTAQKSLFLANVKYS